MFISSLNRSRRQPKRRCPPIGVVEEGDEEFLQLLMSDDCICQIRRDHWKPISHQIKKGAVHAKATMEGTIVTELEIIQKEE